MLAIKVLYIETGLLLSITRFRVILGLGYMYRLFGTYQA